MANATTEVKILTLTEALEQALVSHGLSWSDLENLSIQNHGVVDSANGRRILNGVRLSAGSYLAFYAYTQERIFGLVQEDESNFAGISSVPRNPTNAEPPFPLGFLEDYIVNPPGS